MGTLIMGSPVATETQLKRYLKKANPYVTESVLNMLHYYLEEGKNEGVRGDIAAAQSMLETGNFTFEGSAVRLEQNNFAGMGVIQNGMQGESWDTPQMGIRAQIQHLKAYACTDALMTPCVDGRFKYVQRGCAKYVEWLGIQENPIRAGWASGKGYGNKILNILSGIMDIEREESEDKMRINIHAGHNFHTPGASGLFNETEEDRKVKNLVIEKLRTEGHMVYDCTDEDGTTERMNLANIVGKCNQHTVDCDVSLHFNSFNQKANGVEVLIYAFGSAVENIAQRVADRIEELGYTKRAGGVKERSDLYVLKHTSNPAMLVECCFCDSAKDAAMYSAETMANAIVAGITGKSMAGNKPVTVAKGWLSKGDAGNAVTEWQKTLNVFGSEVNTDGDFGTDTEAQTIRIQRLVGTNPDGCVGEKTRNAVSAYLNADNWIQVRDGRWWYRHADGSYKKNDWEKIGGVWFHFDAAGWMQTGWVKDDEKWYYLKANGAMVSDGLVRSGGKVYYVDKSGKMCYTDASGALR